MPPQLPPVRHIQRQAEWEACLREITKAPQLAIDLEANGMYAYREQVCLIQLSTREQDYIVDPLVGLELSPLGAIIADPTVEKVLHAAEYDLILMKRDYNWEMHNLFDTMWASRILGVERIGLANVLEAHFGVKLNKKYQRANWSQRPLKKEQLIYAQMDTHYLLQLRDILGAQLAAGGHLEESADIFDAQTRVRLPDTDFDAESFWSINGIDDLKPHQKGILRALNIYRDEEARKRNRPPFKVFSNRALIGIAQNEPRTFTALQAIDHLGKWQVNRYGRQLLRLVELGANQPPPRRKRKRRKPDAVLARYDRLRQWRKDRADARKVASDVIISRDAMWDLAAINPQNSAELSHIESLGNWQRATYGPEILAVLHNNHSKSQP
ncbi:MAG: HRDC domain-containing protein [Anaerolineae bacterium]|nr:HRDC domain-containing protein [Anaerolineae bacterium]